VLTWADFLLGPKCHNNGWRTKAKDKMKNVNRSQAPDNVVLFCDRCGVELRPGTGDHYVVHIEAVADPAPPNFASDEPPAGLRRKIDQLLAQMQDLSAQEAMDQVYRRVVIYLCIPCYRPWIEGPAESPRGAP
jgi:hypothetical protein